MNDHECTPLWEGVRAVDLDEPGSENVCVRVPCIADCGYVLVRYFSRANFLATATWEDE
jgi:hypothetical protein